MTLTVEKTLDLDAPPERVWRALTEPEEISAWFGDSAELELRPGGGGWFGWEEHGRYAVRVETVDPPHRLAWRWCHEPGASVDQGPSTLVEWRLTALPEGGTRLELRESGFETRKHWEENTQGWNSELAELVAHLEATA